MAAFSGGAKPSAPSPAGGIGGSGKKLNWSERQAETKRQQAAEEAGSAAASAASECNKLKIHLSRLTF